MSLHRRKIITFSERHPCVDLKRLSELKQTERPTDGQTDPAIPYCSVGDKNRVDYPHLVIMLNVIIVARAHLDHFGLIIYYKM